MFNTLKLKGRILVGYSVPVVLLLLFAGIVSVQVNSTKKASESLAVTNENIDDGLDTFYALANMQKYGRGYLLARSDISLNQYQEAKAEFSENFKELQQAVKDPQQLENLEKIGVLGEKIDALNQQLMALVNQGKVAEAISKWKTGEGRELAEQLDVLIENFETREEEILAEKQLEQNAALNSLITMTIVIAILAVVFSIVLSFLASTTLKLLGNTASEIASSSNEIAATIQQQERTIAQQASSVNETTITMEELGASSRQAAEQAEASASGAREVLTVAENGSDAVKETMEGMTLLKEQVRSIAEQIMRLSEQSGQITGISDLVADIANQTNMLALNAAVEAARAGEQGKGFSVVASEIRKLADESKKSAEKINTLVSDLQASMNSTVMVTDEGTKKTERSIELAQKTAQSFSSVTEAINNVFVNTQQISLSSKQQAVAVQQVIAAMNAINLGAQENSAGINQVRVSTEQLNVAAKNLQTVV
ncbi:chemotaxis protein [Candidatus Gracilibacteria bacterium]|jgi:methyl-accepting chemotaxis protein|nr:chemotaxis protein [Candidatus Gracilibacteria bacterium]NJM86915.1 chemotaxis protein [Hydrococcus sp. RU_2_2]NJP20153.1 chemotaxis protein [Hydrococcus sp. CRU_1_1]NJQ97917.1 chemotaxis protein [Hydrococcus sp. CSU_1_8]